MKFERPQHIRIIWAIMAKDIVQSIKNSTVLGVIIGVFLLILPSQFIPLLLQNESTPMAVIVSSLNRSSIKGLAEDPGTAILTRENIENMKDEIVSGRRLVIGLAFPEEISEINGSQPLIIDGYLPHWTNAEDRQILIQHFETLIRNIYQVDSQIRIIDDQVHPDENTRGSEVMFIIQMINAIITISLILVPQLFMVEKETHTIDALLTSPANFNDFVIGKGLAGSFYGLMAALIVILLNTRLVAHWWLLIITVLSGVAFAVLLGLLLGLIFDNFQQATMAFSFVLIIAIAPAFVKLILTVNFPAWVDAIIEWLPSGKMAGLLQMSLFKEVNLPYVSTGLLAIWGINVVLFLWIILRVRREMVS